MKTSADISCRSRQQAVGSRQSADSPRRIGSAPSRASLRFLLTAYCLLPTAYFLTACGKIGDPLPPIPRAPLVVNELTAAQRGTDVILTFPVTRPPRSRNVRRADIYRLSEPESAPLGLTEEEFSARASVIASIPGEQIPAGSATVTYTDPIDFRQTTGDRRFRYAVRLVDVEDRAAGFSNYATVTPLSEIAGPPTDLRAKLSQTELEVTWQPPTANLSGSAPANVLGYNVYRTSGGATVKLNAQPLAEARYADRQFQFGTPYEYAVRSVSLPNPGAPPTAAIESDASRAVSITPRDTFAPSAPSSVTVASVGGIVSLFWPANPEPDVVGYNVYRATDASAPPEQWTKVTPRPITTITFSDDRVRVGERYYYQITAVDNVGNESARSETQSEIVNP
jgi:hypothetical protein